MGAIAQIIQAAVDVGIAKAAVRDTIYFVRNHTLFQSKIANLKSKIC